MSWDYRVLLSRLTEDWDTLADSVQREAASLRYGLTRDYATNKVAVDVGCGTGFGIDWVAQSSTMAVGGDLSFQNLKRAKSRSDMRRWVQLDAQALPFRSSVVDVVTCFESMYYFPDIPIFLAEAHRVLRPQGRLLVSFPNKSRPGFNPSPGSYAYPDGRDFTGLCREVGFSSAEIYGAFDLGPQPVGRRVLDHSRRMIARLGLMPKSMALRGMLKRLAYRDVKALTPLQPLQAALDHLTLIHPDSEGTPTDADRFMVLYVIVTK